MAFIEEEFDLESELERLAKPVLCDGLLGRSWDPCEWPGISSHLSAFLASHGALAAVLDTLKIPKWLKIVTCPPICIMQ
jgi:hypothetical protein